MFKKLRSKLVPKFKFSLPKVKLPTASELKVAGGRISRFCGLDHGTRVLEFSLDLILDAKGAWQKIFVQVRSVKTVFLSYLFVLSAYILGVASLFNLLNLLRFGELSINGLVFEFVLFLYQIALTFGGVYVTGKIIKRLINLLTQFECEEDMAMIIAAYSVGPLIIVRLLESIAGQNWWFGVLSLASFPTYYHAVNHADESIYKKYILAGSMVAVSYVVQVILTGRMLKGMVY